MVIPFIHSSSEVDDGAVIGEDTKIWHFSHVLKNTRIGKGCNIGQNVVIGPDVTVGNRCKIQNNVSVYKGVILEDEVFCGPSMVFTNVFNPRSAIRRMDEIRPTLVKTGASIGANATIVCGVTIGEYAFVGAGAVVTRDVPAHALVIGNPARQTGWICECGEKLDPGLTCPGCGKIHSGLGEDSADANEIAFVDLAAQQRRILPKIQERINGVLKHGKYIMGPEVGELEARLAEFTGAAHVVTCSSGTDALIMALMAAGIGPGQAVFTTPFTFAATAEAVCLLGAIPVFVDIDPDTYNLSVEKLDKAVARFSADGLVPKAVIPVDLFGLPCDYDGIGDVAQKYNLVVIEDAAQSFGARYQGKSAGTLGDMGCTSFFPAKPLGCYGDGGAVFTDSDEAAEKLRSIRIHGKGRDKYDNVRLGLNGRLDTIQAAVLLPKLEIFKEEVELRNQVAARYTDLLSDFAGEAGWSVPTVPKASKSVWAQYSILTGSEEERDKVIVRLKQNNIPSAVYYPRPLHLQTVYRGIGCAEETFPVAEKCARRIFSLPMHPYLTEAQQKRICCCLQRGA